MCGVLVEFVSQTTDADERREPKLEQLQQATVRSLESCSADLVLPRSATFANDEFHANQDLEPQTRKIAHPKPVRPSKGDGGSALLTAFAKTPRTPSRLWAFRQETEDPGNPTLL